MAQDYAGLQAGNMRKDVKEEITRLGLDYRLMTQFTSLFFNLFNVTNILGWSNYSGYAIALARDSANAGDPGFLKSSSFGRPLTTAGRLFTAGGPRSFQFVARFSF